MIDKKERDSKFENLLERASQWLSEEQLEMARVSWKFDSECNAIETVENMLDDYYDVPEAETLRQEAEKWLADGWPNHPSHDKGNG